MPNVHTTLTSLFSAIANAIRGKTGSSAQIVADDFPSAIDAIPTGTPLPSLTNPASASDILDGKEAIDGQGQMLTGTLVPPVDTGANGLYKAFVIGDTSSLPSIIYDESISNISTANGRLRPIDVSGVKEIHFPNLNSVGNNAVFVANGNLYVAEFGASLNIPSNINSQGFLVFGATNPSSLKINGVAGWGECASVGLRRVAHLHFISSSIFGVFTLYNAGGGIYVRSITFDNLTSLGRGNFGNSANSTFASLIIRTPTMCVATGSLTYRLSDISTGFTKIYVPKSLESSYKSATNWTTVASQIYGIDEDTTATVGTAFTPTTSATVDHWDQVDLQSYSVGTIDTTTGSITPTHDGRLLIRGLDASDNIVHVTYLQIGTGFDEEANLA